MMFINFLIIFTLDIKINFFDISEVRCLAVPKHITIPQSVTVCKTSKSKIIFLSFLTLYTEIKPEIVNGLTFKDCCYQNQETYWFQWFNTVVCSIKVHMSKTKQYIQNLGPGQQAQNFFSFCCYQVGCFIPVSHYIAMYQKKYKKKK